jgi:hypothetical protein
MPKKPLDTVALFGRTSKEEPVAQHARSMKALPPPVQENRAEYHEHGDDGGRYP